MSFFPSPFCLFPPLEPFLDFFLPLPARATFSSSSPFYWPPFLEPCLISSCMKSYHNVSQPERFSCATIPSTKTSHFLEKPPNAILTNYVGWIVSPTTANSSFICEILVRYVDIMSVLVFLVLLSFSHNTIFLFSFELWYNLVKDSHISKVCVFLETQGMRWSLMASRVILLAYMFFFLNSSNCCGSLRGTTTFSTMSHNSNSSNNNTFLSFHGLKFSAPFNLSSTLKTSGHATLLNQH